MLGTRIVEVLATKKLTTTGLKAWRPANVSPGLTGVGRCLFTLNGGFRIVSLFLLVIIPHVQTSAAATTTIASSCLTCDTIKKSGKLSCCARGGSWFGNCGASNTKVQHTWYEGTQACAARQSKDEYEGIVPMDTVHVQKF